MAEKDYGAGYRIAPLAGSWRSLSLVALAAGGLTIGVLAMVLFSHQSASVPQKTVRTVDVTVIPPPPPPPPQAAEAPPAPSQSLPYQDAPARQSPTLEPLQLSLQPAPTQALAGEPLAEQSFALDMSENLVTHFRFEDLSEAPRVLNNPRINFPDALIRRGIKEGKVVAEIAIDREGHARLIRWLSVSHRELEPEARQLIRRVRFTRPLHNGEVVEEVRGEWPILMQAPQ